MPPISPTSLVLLGLGASCGGMTLLWLVQRRTRNAAIVDVGWTLTVGGLGVAYALLLVGTPGRRLLLGTMAGLWAARLAGHLLRDRIAGQPEEGRYVRLRERWGARFELYVLGFFFAQAFVAVLLSLAFLPGAMDARPAFDRFDRAGGLLFLVAWIGEALADHQLARFKAREGAAGHPGSPKGVCTDGLWAWSRHPNYFFEWLTWCAFVLPGLPHQYGLVALAAPALMLLLILKVTGVPTSEAQALRSRGEAYRAYQRRVSVFFPWPPKFARSP